MGEFVASDRDRFVVATKYTLFNREVDLNAAGNHRKNMVQSLEASLKRLRLDYVDLLWLHAWDFMTPVEEVMRGLDDLVRAGKVLYVGISDTPAWVVSQANTLADLQGWSPFVALQIEYSLIQRTPERDLLPMARALDLAVTPWGILGSGVLTGKYNQDQPPKEGRAREDRGQDPEILEIGAEVVAVAKEMGCTPTQVAVAWIREQPGVMIRLLGARTLEQIQDSLGALGIALRSEHLGRLDDATRDRIDNHRLG